MVHSYLVALAIPYSDLSVMTDRCAYVRTTKATATGTQQSWRQEPRTNIVEARYRWGGGQG
jgi:hypothetical protein